MLPVNVDVPATTVFPVPSPATVNLFVSTAIPPSRFARPLAVIPATVDAPVTPKVPPTVVLPVNVDVPATTVLPLPPPSTVNLFVSTAIPPSKFARPLAVIPATVEAPVTPKVPPTVVFPVTAKVSDNVAAPVTPNVPPTVVLPVKVEVPLVTKLPFAATVNSPAPPVASPTSRVSASTFVEANNVEPLILPVVVRFSSEKEISPPTTATVKSVLLFVSVANKVPSSFKKISAPSASRVMSVVASRMIAPEDVIDDASIVNVSTVIPAFAVNAPVRVETPVTPKVPPTVVFPVNVDVPATTVLPVPPPSTVNLFVSTAIPPSRFAKPLEVIPVKPEATVPAKTVSTLATVVSVPPSSNASLNVTSAASR